MRLLGEFGELGGYPKPLERFARRVFGLPPTQDDAEGVAQMTAARWVTMPERVWTIYRTDPVALARSDWLAGLPIFRGVRSVLELGCGPGRNLAALRQRYPEMMLRGVDINGAACEEASGVAWTWRADLYEPLNCAPADVLLTMGVLIHLRPERVMTLLGEMAQAARWLVLVEQVSEGDDVVKGPRAWHPMRRVTGSYVQWSPNIPAMLRWRGLAFTQERVPEAVQANGARDVFVVTCPGDI